MPPKGWKSIPVRDEDYIIIKAFIQEEGLKDHAAVRKAFQKGFGLKFPSAVKA
jgi:hypothetical protein